MRSAMRPIASSASSWSIRLPRGRSIASGRRSQAACRTVCLFPAMHRYALSDPRAAAVIAAAAAADGAALFVHCGVLTVGIRKKLGLPSRFDMRFGNPVDLHGIALDHPSLPIIVPHFGAGFFREALMLADLCPNVVLDTSSSNHWMAYEPGAHAGRRVQAGAAGRRPVAAAVRHRLVVLPARLESPGVRRAVPGRAATRRARSGHRANLRRELRSTFSTGVRREGLAGRGATLHGLRAAPGLLPRAARGQHLRPPKTGCYPWRFRPDGGCSSVAERRTVAPEVAGSNPVIHPNSPSANLVH